MKNLMIIALIALFSCGGSGYKNPPKEWSKLTYEEKAEWLEYYKGHLDDAGYALVSMMEQNIRNKFKYPDEVKFDDYPIFRRGIVSMPDEGMIVINGKGSAKNAFGVLSKFNYSCVLTITDTKRELIEVRVSDP